MSEPDPRPVDLLALAAGIVVLVLCLAFAVGDLDTFADQARVVWPTALVGAGAVLLAGTLRGRDDR